jgi:hypothetical protein
MKAKTGWSTYPRWEWERTGEIAVFAADDSISEQKPTVITELKKVLSEFEIPLKVFDENVKHNLDRIHILRLLIGSIRNNEIDCENFESELRDARKEGRLPYGLIILLDRQKNKFYCTPGQDPPIYGWGVPDGLVLLRHTHREAIRHEFGHMLGLIRHHDNCVMSYICDVPTFCTNCKQDVREMWRAEIEDQ